MRAETEITMDEKTMKDFILEFQDKDPANRVPAELAKDPKYTGRKIYDGVICGIADAGDELLASLRGNEGANINMMLPQEWLEGAKSVLSFFMPFERWITEENEGGDWPSCGWLHGRIEGQEALNKMSIALSDRIREEGYEAVTPALDPRLKIYMNNNEGAEPVYTSNWSERHVAFIAGLGTFGMSRGIITERGMAGRLMSIVTTLQQSPTPRPYTDLLEYCEKCGDCINNCPPNAISVENLKDHGICDIYLSGIRKQEEPYYGCGKCQSGVRCAFGIPGRS